MGRRFLFDVGNIIAAAWCTVCIAILGFGMLIGGAVLAGIYLTEIRPTDSDPNFDRYRGAHFELTVGIVLLTFGLLLLVGACIFFGCAFAAANNDYKNSSSSGSYTKAPVADEKEKEVPESYPV